MTAPPRMAPTTANTLSHAGRMAAPGEKIRPVVPLYSMDVPPSPAAARGRAASPLSPTPPERNGTGPCSDRIPTNQLGEGQGILRLRIADDYQVIRAPGKAPRWV